MHLFIFPLPNHKPAISHRFPGEVQENSGHRGQVEREMATSPAEDYKIGSHLHHYIWKVHSDSPSKKAVSFEKDSSLNSDIFPAQSHPSHRATHSNCSSPNPSGIGAILTFPDTTLVLDVETKDNRRHRTEKLL